MYAQLIRLGTAKQIQCFNPANATAIPAPSMHVDIPPTSTTLIDRKKRAHPTAAADIHHLALINSNACSMCAPMLHY
jgi:hypothetical protein